jgi:hypothetical protein
MELIYLVNVLMLIAGGILAASGLIVAKKPNAKELIDKLVPFQVIIGVALLGLGVVSLLWWVGHGLLTLVTHGSFFGVTVLAGIVTSILLGFMFGMPQIAKWMPGQQEKGMELSKQLAPFQGILGLVGIGAGLLMLLFRFGILGVGF